MRVFYVAAVAVYLCANSWVKGRDGQGEGCDEHGYILTKISVRQANEPMTPN